MRPRQSPVESLVILPQLEDPVDRETQWRKAIAALGQDARLDGPPPLDGVSPEDLLAATRVALETGLVDDLDWIAPGAAAVALYELSSELPPGKERRDIGRRVLARLYEGDAATFAAVAARMALGAGRPFEASAVRARIGLVFNLPIGSSVNADPLALVLASRRELFDGWIAKAATGPLGARRMAARLFELASREAVRRADDGDPHSAELLVGAVAKPVFERLLADREPLVWRHAALARGILSAAIPRLREEIDLALDPTLSPTEWRRAGVSLVACASNEGKNAIQQCFRLLEGEIVAKDPGMIATLVWGLPPVVDAEPDWAFELLERLVRSGRADVRYAAETLLADLSSAELYPSSELLRRLTRDEAVEDSVHASIKRALRAYETAGARAAHELALAALERANASMDVLDAADTPIERLLGALGDLDESAIERSRLHDLLLLGRSPGDTNSAVPEMDRLCDRLSHWILDREAAHVDGDYSEVEITTRQQSLRTLLHLVDLDSSTGSDGGTDGVKARVRRTIVVLLDALAAGPDASVHRIMCAALARGLDAAAREGFADPADLVLILVERVADAHGIQAVLEASTHADVRDVLRAYGEFVARTSRERATPAFDVFLDPAEQSHRDESSDARAFVAFSRGIGANGSYLGEALRQVVFRLGSALERIASARGLSDLVEAPGGDGYPLLDVEKFAGTLGELVRGARRRVLGENTPSDIDVVTNLPPVSALVERAIARSIWSTGEFAMSARELVASLPEAFARPISDIIADIPALPVAPPSEITAIPLQIRRTELPDCLLPRKTIGAFYVVRALGSGGASSVFIARRIEERHTLGAELYALKVPHYDPNTARSLSEDEFMQLFRDEAGALLSLPQHPNLSRFVTFDLAARPKPILVMELIRGQALDRLIRSQSLTLAVCIDYLDGILAGLEAMHDVGVGHLDVKPSNVILRDEGTPVLVDFGLSGRHLRPGCGTLEYSAPEILSHQGPSGGGSPLAADIYAFACCAFEVFTGTVLFDDDDELVLMKQHMTHDGWPPRLTALASTLEYENLCLLMAACLRNDPALRPRVASVRRAFAIATAPLVGVQWPLRATPSEMVTGLTA